mmetsp:Transcript_111297/g.197115  ORF Transcript_111297/g.197115 Transcript_111297/m.197115 type:complete len:139 (+) Transcript_111297:95-511(+)
MASNSLRGGKNIYSHSSLMSNWFEERFEIKHQEAAIMKAMSMPTKTAKTWSQTSHGYGSEHKDAMSKSVMATETGNWLKYQKDGADRYHTTAGRAYCHPKEQVPAHEAPHIPEEALKDYRQKWTKTDPLQFKRVDAPR